MADGEQPDDAQKTEEPPPKKLEESRKKGQVALSREVNNWVMLCAATILIAAMGNQILGDLSDILEAYLARAHAIPAAPGGMSIALGEGFKKVLAVMALPLIMLMLAAFLSPFIQIGPLLSAETIKPKLEKISPIKGFFRLFSLRSLMEFFKGVLKITAVGVVGAIILYPYYDKLEHLVGLPVPVALS